MGRAPCCDKANVKKGPWAPEEDATLKAYIEEHGTGGNWIALPQKIGLKRCGKSCRLRWLNYLRPNIKHGGFSEEEDRIICSLYVSIGSRWSIIAAQLPGRTDNDIKNYWNTRLKKKLLGKQRKEQISRRKGELLMKKGRSAPISEIPSSIIVSTGNENNNNNCQDPYWPTLPPVPYSNSNQEPCFVNNHASIRKLLIKLGGRFSCDDNGNNQSMVSNFPIDLPASLMHDDNDKFIACTTPVSNSSSTSMLLNSQYDNVLPIVQEGQSGCFPSEMYTQKMDGLEFLYGDMCEMNTSGSSSVITDSMDWGEMSSLISTTTTTSNVMNSYNFPRSLQQDCAAYDHHEDHVQQQPSSITDKEKAMIKETLII